MTPPGPPPEGAVARLEGTRKYRGVCMEMALRLAREEAPKSRTDADLDKRLRRRLHQAFGAYVARGPDYGAILGGLRAALGDDALWRAACRSGMAEHASTRERLPIVERFWPALWGEEGPPRRLLDLGAGLGPLALPWMGTPPELEHCALDVDSGLVGLLSGFFELAGAQGEARAWDALSAAPPRGPWDVALLLKLAPLLERQRPGSALGLIDAIDAPKVVVSFPTRSLGGSNKGMAAHYRNEFQGQLAGRPWRSRTVEFPGELAFVVDKRA